jgi:hypothetical protein
VFALAGCAGSASVPQSTASPTDTQPASPSPEPTETQTPRTLTIEISPTGAGNEAPHGTAVVDVEGEGYTLTLNVEGLTANGHYPVNIHAGQCQSMDTELIIWVSQDIQADDAGVLTFENTYSIPWVVPDAGRVLTIHGRFPGAERTHIGCADMTN